MNKKKKSQFSGIAKQLNLLLQLTLVWWIGWWKPGEARGAGNLTIYSLNKQEALWRVEQPDTATAAWHLHRKKNKKLSLLSKTSSEADQFLQWGGDAAQRRHATSTKKDINPFWSHQHRLSCVLPAFWPYNPTVVVGIWTCHKGADPFCFQAPTR